MTGLSRTTARPSSARLVPPAAPARAARFDRSYPLRKGMTTMTRNGIGAVLAALVMLGCSNPGDGGAGGSGGHPIGGGPAGGGSGHPAGGSAPTTTTVVYTEAVNRDLDLVFVVDNSSSMSKAQANLRT